ncbi:MAG: MEDS domain-containing protein [Acidobacteria bacterium]|nr:MEDS domain-containing protein [Acidobacteriota bacterium]
MRHQPDSASSHAYHAVRFYENDKSLAKIVADFLADGLASGAPAIVIATLTQRAAIVRELAARGMDVASLKAKGDLELLDAFDLLSSFVKRGTLDARAFTDNLCAVIERACDARSDCTVRIYGQMVDILWREGKRELAIRLEVLWNQLARTQRFSLLCGYAIGPFYKDACFGDVCAQHTHVLGKDGAVAAAVA